MARAKRKPRQLAALSHRLGVSAETHRCRWDGARPDYSTLVEVLDRKERVSAETSARK